MNNYTQKETTCFDSEIYDQDIQEYEIDNWDQREFKIMKTNIQILFKQNHKIIYSQDGDLLRVEQISDMSINEQIVKNIEQIKNLKREDIQGDNMKKNSKWIASWDGEILIDVGGYFNEGQKHGLWIELITNYWSRVKVYELGEYLNDRRIGFWEYIYKNNCIGGGSYNNLGQKNGKWIELSDRFLDGSQITYNGQYNMQGQKVNIWDIKYIRNDQQQLLGGRLYDQKEGLKIGNWVELSNSFNMYSQIIYNGEYNLKGNKIGIWNIMLRNKDQFEQIGGGSYDDQQGLKIGKWIDQMIPLTCILKSLLMVNIIRMVKSLVDGILCLKRIINFNNGGGLYEKEGGQKVGQWIEPSDNFKENQQVTYNGEYNMNGKKIARWNIMYNDRIMNTQMQFKEK
ncbi:unnamed protein product [Paramecium sonneborni]|uniref:Uncharacterized protein n=1 Tax=Paramecium sonneborni TaxID=65129 RepID=A0A8S1RQN3_9CILI|nr:unnamed protein product [Paramecium sonneborni]